MGAGCLRSCRGPCLVGDEVGDGMVVLAREIGRLGALRGTGVRTRDADCRVASLLAMTFLKLCHSEEAQRADVGIRVPLVGSRDCQGSALSAERAAGQIRSLPDN